MLAFLHNILALFVPLTRFLETGHFPSCPQSYWPSSKVPWKSIVYCQFSKFLKYSVSLHFSLKMEEQKEFLNPFLGNMFGCSMFFVCVLRFGVVKLGLIIKLKKIWFVFCFSSKKNSKIYQHSEECETPESFNGNPG